VLADGIAIFLVTPPVVESDLRIANRAMPWRASEYRSPPGYCAS
jgi:hypothetical protein